MSAPQQNRNLPAPAAQPMHSHQPPHKQALQRILLPPFKSYKSEPSHLNDSIAAFNSGVHAMICFGKTAIHRLQVTLRTSHDIVDATAAFVIDASKRTEYLISGSMNDYKIQQSHKMRAPDVDLPAHLQLKINKLDAKIAQIMAHDSRIISYTHYAHDKQTAKHHSHRPLSEQSRKIDALQTKKRKIMQDWLKGQS